MRFTYSRWICENIPRTDGIENIVRNVFRVRVAPLSAFVLRRCAKLGRVRDFLPFPLKYFIPFHAVVLHYLCRCSLCFPVRAHVAVPGIVKFAYALVSTSTCARRSSGQTSLPV